MFDQKTFNILYIDDSKDSDLSFYLNESLKEDEYFKQNNINLIIKEYRFKNEKYEDLLQKEEIRSSNIIIIDSMLFKDNDCVDNEFSGEEFSIMLENINSCISVIVITQNNSAETDKFGMVKKYVDNDTEDVTTYYDRELKNIIKDSIKQLIYKREKAIKLDKNKNIDKIAVKKINNLLSGICEYNELSKKDVDALIKNFKNIENILKEQSK